MKIQGYNGEHPARSDMRQCEGIRSVTPALKPHYAHVANFPEKGAACSPCLDEARRRRTMAKAHLNDFGAFDSQTRPRLWKIWKKADPGSVVFVFSLSGYTAQGAACVYFGSGIDHYSLTGEDVGKADLGEGCVVIERDTRPEGVGGIRIFDAARLVTFDEAQRGEGLKERKLEEEPLRATLTLIFQDTNDAFQEIDIVYDEDATFADCLDAAKSDLASFHAKIVEADPETVWELRVESSYALVSESAKPSGYSGSRLLLVQKHPLPVPIGDPS